MSSLILTSPIKITLPVSEEPKSPNLFFFVSDNVIAIPLGTIVGQLGSSCQV